MKMIDVFRLPVTTMSLAYNTASDESNTVILDAVAHAINQHDKLVEAISLFLAYNDATDDDDDVAMMLMYADALKAAREAIVCESE